LNNKKIWGSIFNIYLKNKIGMKSDCSKENLEKLVKNSYSVTDVIRKLGLSIAGRWNRDTIKKYISEYNLDITHFKVGINLNTNVKKINLSEILIENSTYGSSKLKKRLYDEGLKERKCELCGQDENWKGKIMSLILDHKNGINNDNRLENLQIVCPNCNATLPTHCRGKNKMDKINQKKELKKNKFIIRSMNQRKVKRPIFDDLKKEIINFGLEGVGRKYGVTGNAIKKWIKTYEKHGF